MPDLTRIDALLDAVEKHLSMDDLLGTLGRIRDIDRFFTSPKFLESAHMTADELRAGGCDEAEVIEFPADGKTAFADFVMPLAWDADEAVLEIVRPAGVARVIARRSAEPNTTVVWCGPTPPEGISGGIVLWDELDEAQRKAADLRGKFLYTRKKPAGLKAAALRAGALGVIGSYGFDRARPEFRDCVAWNNSWSETTGWAMVAADKPLPGLCISPAAGDLLERLSREHADLMLRATVRSRLYEGTIPAVSGLLHGATDREIVLIGHQFEIGANDNASGCAAIIEAARCIRKMVAAGDLPRPTRSARFMTCAEMFTSIPFAIARPEVMKRTVTGLNLDMICPYGGFEESVMDFYESPDSNPSFGDDLLELIIRRVWERNGSPWQWKRKKTELSDNCWCDPFIGVPMSWLSWHGREFWHSSGDTIDRIVPAAVHDVALASITWLAWLLTAGERDIAWLVRLEAEYAGERMRGVAERLDLMRPPECARALVQADVYLASREAYRAAGIARLACSSELDAAARTFAGTVVPLPKPELKAGDEAARIVPVRRCAAPLTFSRIPESERWGFASPLWNQPLNCALYWCDGKRTIREIEWLLRLERGSFPLPDIVRWFIFLEQNGFVELRRT